MRIGTTVETVWSNLARFLLLVLAAAAACTSGAPDLEEELRAIEALNQHDVDAVLSSDFDALISQWTEDFVVISPGAVARGRSANAALLEGARAMSDQLEPVEHVLDFEETIVSGDYASQGPISRSTGTSVVSKPGRGSESGLSEEKPAGAIGPSNGKGW